ncbi:hypothetical protein [Kitasatospora sp. NPDC101183]|uniref:hypothetical protein n=1 Tax=Kitasatospora sp. NPDC101183 TaxID=3364100 RepID=UPI00380A9DCB
MTASDVGPTDWDPDDLIADLVADRLFVLRTARRFVAEHPWPDGYEPGDVMAVARFLAGEES